MHPVIRPIFCNILGINWQYQLEPCPIQEIHTREQPHYHPPPQGHLRLRFWRLHRCLAYNQQYSSVKFSSFASIWPAGELVTCCSRRLQLEGIWKWAIICQCLVNHKLWYCIIGESISIDNWHSTLGCTFQLPSFSPVQHCDWRDSRTPEPPFLFICGFPPLRAFLTRIKQQIWPTKLSHWYW